MTDSTFKNAAYGAAAYKDLHGELPQQFPRDMGPNAMKYLAEVVESGLAEGMNTRFEKAFADAYGVRHCIGTPGCTPALAMLAASFDFAPGDEIIVSPLADFGTLQGLLRQNYIPVFADTMPGTVNAGAATIEPLITDRTRAILLVHKTGLVCDMDPILELAASRGVVVYEDVCQAVFSEYRGRLAGTMGLAAGFSFDSEKTMGSDTGGCVITNDDALAERLRFVGQSRGGVQVPGYGRKHTVEGYAFRMPLCTAAISLAQLEIVRPQVEQRDRMARLLHDLLAEIPNITPLPIPDYQTKYSCWMYGFSIDPQAFDCTPAEFGQEVATEGIPGAGVAEYYLMPEALEFLKDKAARHTYPYSLPPASRDYTYGAAVCPEAQKFVSSFIRWATFTDRYQPHHMELAAAIVARVADRHRR